MRISVITNFAYGVTVVLTALSGTAFILSSHNGERERAAVEQHLAFDDMGDELALAVEERSDAARLYVMTGESTYLQSFKIDEGEEHRRAAAIEAFRSEGMASAEQDALTQMEQAATDLDRLEEDNVAAFQRQEQDAARRGLFGPAHERLHDALLDAVTRFRALVASRTGDALDRARDDADAWGLAAKIMLGLTAAVFLAVLYFVVRRRVAIPLVAMTGVVSRLAKQDYAVEVPLDGRRDEIGELNQAIQIFRENGLERDRLDAERRLDQMTKDLILQMMHRLQACQSQAEQADVVALFAPQIFPEFAGRLLVMNDSRTTLSTIGQWADPQHGKDGFASAECWAIRRGRPHVSDGHHGDVECQHRMGGGGTAICIPLTAQGDTIGLLCLEERAGGSAHLSGVSRLYLELIAENIGLAMANLHLRDRLTQLAVRDALTGLLNRRSLDGALSRRDRGQSGRPMACLMIDIDHFKRFNDQFGHDAGDEVMRHVAVILAETTGDLGTVYRFGGEEFVVIAPGLDMEEARALAERIRLAVMHAPLSHRGRILGSVTVSVGFASAETPTAGETVLAAADAALLHAKASGRNRSTGAADILPADRMLSS